MTYLFVVIAAVSSVAVDIPIQIATITDLKNINDNLAGNYILKNDIL